MHILGFSGSPKLEYEWESHGPIASFIWSLLGIAQLDVLIVPSPRVPSKRRGRLSLCLS